MKSEYRYAELVGQLKTTVNILTTQIPVKCDWIGNVSLSDYLTFTPYTQECNGKGYSHSFKETRMTTNSTQKAYRKRLFS
jgi:hypothetical protein